MRLSFNLVLLFGLVPVTVFACEGECIVGITKAFIGNYSRPIHAVLEEVAKRLVTEIVLPNRVQNPSPTPLHSPMSYLEPLVSAYDNHSYSAMEIAIFPSYFHGKCQINGVDPVGCPDPDCPVVCGTPGSLVHFYPKLRGIAFTETTDILRNLTVTGSHTYEKILKRVLSDIDGGAPHISRRRSLPRAHAESWLTTRDRLEMSDRSVDASTIKIQFKEIMTQMPSLLLKACGGSSKNLTKCSWESDMKKYILSFN